MFDVLIVIIKQGPPRVVPNMENVVIAEQLAQEERQYAGPANTDHDQVNDDITTTFRPKIRRQNCRIFHTSLSHVRHY